MVDIGGMLRLAADHPTLALASGQPWAWAVAALVPGLAALGCDDLQGYWFAKRMTATALALSADGDDAQDGVPAMFRPSLFDATAHAPRRAEAPPVAPKVDAMIRRALLHR